MNNFFTTVFTITFIMQPINALAADYSNFDSHCQAQLQHGLALIEKEVESGDLSESEAKEEIDTMPSMLGECVCYYQKFLEDMGADFVLYMQKVDIIQMDDDYTDEQIRQLGIPKLPENLDLDAFVIDVEKACGLEPE